jgi:hypothetical protein
MGSPMAGERTAADGTGRLNGLDDLIWAYSRHASTDS